MNKKRCHRLISLACKTAAYIIGCGDGENMQIETMGELVQCTAYVNVRFLHFVSFFLISFALFFFQFSLPFLFFIFSFSLLSPSILLFLFSLYFFYPSFPLLLLSLLPLFPFFLLFISFLVL